MNCPSCNGVLVEPMENFCGLCGVALQIICDRCQVKNSASNRFCENCGKTLGEKDELPELTESSVDRLFNQIMLT